MSHHYSGPDFGFPHGDARLDLTDLYAFPKPGEADKSILIMNVHPSAVVNPPGPTTREPFASEALYELKIDTNGDAVADIAYRVRFSSSADGPQTATVRRVEDAQAAETGDSGQVVIEAAPVSTGRDARWTAQAGFGSRRTGARYPRKRSFSSARSEMATTRASRRTMPVSSPSSRMRWSTPVAMRRRKQGGWREHCCPTCCPTTRRVPRLFRAMAVRSPTMPPTPSWQSSQTGR